MKIYRVKKRRDKRTNRTTYYLEKNSISVLLIKILTVAYTFVYLRSNKNVISFCVCLNDFRKEEKINKHLISILNNYDKIKGIVNLISMQRQYYKM